MLLWITLALRKQVWIRPPARHTQTPPSRLLLCIHPGTGMLDPFEGIVSQLSLPSLGLKLTSRSLSGAKTVMDIEERYWVLTNDQMALWRGSGLHQQRSLLGHSFGCRIVFSFAKRFDVAGCTDVRVVIMDGRVAHQPLPDLKEDPNAAQLMDALIAKYGAEAGDNAASLQRIIAHTDYESFRLKNGVLSERAHVLFLRSDQPPPQVQLPELAVNVEVVHIPGLHVTALKQIAHGEPARAMARRFEIFLKE